MEQLIHYSDTPLNRLALHSKSQMNAPTLKPEGLWVSVEDGYGWKDWCEGEKFELENLEYQTKVILSPHAKLLTLDSSGLILEFTEEYGAIPEQLRESPLQSTYIKWTEVEEEYQGIIIAPYCWSLRLDSRTYWYYGWDCSSGCIWDVSAIAELKPLNGES